MKFIIYKFVFEVKRNFIWATCPNHEKTAKAPGAKDPSAVVPGVGRKKNLTEKSD